MGRNIRFLKSDLERHVNLAIRGIRCDGEPLQFRREYLKHGIREIAEDLCTCQIGCRTSHDAAEAERREIGEQRFTSLDREIRRDAHLGTRGKDSAHFTVTKNPAEMGRADSSRLHLKHIIARLAVLRRMGLAEAAASNTWYVRRDFEEIRRAMQRAADRQNTLAAPGLLCPTIVCRSRFSIWSESQRSRAAYWSMGRRPVRAQLSDA
jgi:type IV secretory pathway VirD2 relaxase